MVSFAEGHHQGIKNIDLVGGLGINFSGWGPAIQNFMTCSQRKVPSSGSIDEWGRVTPNTEDNRLIVY